MVHSIVPQLIQETSSLNSSHLPFQGLTGRERQPLVLKMLKVFILTFTSTALLPGHQNDKELSGAMAHFARIISESPLEELITSPELLPDWIDEIFTCQKLVKPFLSSISFEQEGSKGVTYKIRKEGKTLGYLFGTFHYLVTPEMREAAQLSGIVFKRLLKCAVFGTEVALRTDGKHTLGSVDENLMNVAKQRGIANFGIDTPERELAINAIKKEETLTIEEIEHSLAQTLEAYRFGNVEQLKVVSHCNLDSEIEKKRDACMAENIDIFLKVAQVVGQRRNEALHKSFFAIGTAHLLREGPGSIVSILSEKGWTLQLA